MENSNYKEKAEQYVRERLPELRELSFGCEVAINASPSPLHLKIIEPYRGRHHTWLMTEHMVWNENVENAEIIGHPIQLQHWLRALEDKALFTYLPNGVLYVKDEPTMRFSKVTGQPATEQDYKAFCEVVGV